MRILLCFLLLCAVARLRADELTRSVQEQLKAQGAYAGPVTGETTAQFIDALKAYQQRHNLPATGKVDRATAKALDDESGMALTTPAPATSSVPRATPTASPSVTAAGSATVTPTRISPTPARTPSPTPGVEASTPSPPPLRTPLPARTPPPRGTPFSSPSAARQSTATPASPTAARRASALPTRSPVLSPAPARAATSPPRTPFPSPAGSRPLATGTAAPLPRPVVSAPANVPPPPPPSSGQTAVASPAPTASPQLPAQFSAGRVTNFLRDYLRAGESRSVNDQLRFFSFPVTYFGHGAVTSAYVRNDVARYVRRWPVRHYMLTDPVKITAVSSQTVTADFTIAYSVQNGKRHATGRTTNRVTLREVNGELKIVGIDEQHLAD